LFQNTATGAGGPFEANFGHQEVPPFKPQHTNPPYLSRKLIRQQKGPQGAD